ncbi:MAG: molybdopterin-dependent oxidoreductase [Cyclobacteriaceae bacterium]|nr:molybdopterin-dependent oxidoreductase [Cyclobacteriaceae bacterium]
MAKPHTVHTFCRICESLCGLEVTVQHNKILEVKPDENHVATQGFSCIKGLKQHEMYDSPDRLRYPMKKTATGFERVSWQEAMKDMGARIKKIIREDGPNSVAMYVGTAAGFSVLHPVFAQGFMTGLGSRSLYSSSTQDCSNKFAVSRHVYGFPFTLPFPDITHTNCLIIVGANPVISKWSFLQVPNPIKKLRAIEERGGKIFVIDPRKTETAKTAGEHIFIRPGTDVFFYLSFLHELIALGGIDKSRVEQHMTGYDELEKVAAAWPATRTEKVTNIPAEKLKELVKIYSESDGAALYCSTGVNMGGNGAMAYWLQEAINAVSGNLDKKGGTLVGKGIIDFIKFGAKNGLLMRNDRSRIGNLLSVNDAFPGGILADEILTPGKGQIKALIVTGGNPLITMANSEKLREAFRQLDLLVCLDILPGETCQEAHYQLPCSDPFQRPDLPFIFPLMLGLQEKPYLQATKPVIKMQAEQRNESTIYVDLARACGKPLFGSWATQIFFEIISSWKKLILGRKFSTVPQEFVINLLLRLCGQKSFGQLLKFPHGKLRKEHEENSFLGKRVVTSNGKVNLAPEALLQMTPKLETDFEKELKSQERLKLITKRAVTTHNSWTHNLDRMIANGRDTNYLYMHPADAEVRKLHDLDLVDVASNTATVRVPLKLLDELMPGTVALPHGWGHQAAKGLSVASKTRGVNVNILAASGPENLEPLSGMAHLTGIPVEVTKARAQKAETWSGM